MSLTRIGSIGINTGIAFAGVTTIVTLNTANDALSIGATVNVGSGITLGASGDIFATGVCTATSFSGETVVGDTSPQLGGNLDVNTKNIVFGDSSDGSSDDVLSFGAGSDLRLYHDGSNSYIKQVSSGTGNLLIFADGHEIQLIPKSGEPGIKVINDGAVELYHNGTKKFETTSSGVTLGDGLLLDNATNAGRDVQWQPANDRLAFLDNTRATFGNEIDLSIYHDGSHSRIVDSGTGHLIIQTSELDLMNAAGNADLIKATAGASVELYENGSKKFETTTGGATVTGNVFVTGSFRGDDNSKLDLGSGNDLQIYHDGSTNIINGLYHPIELRHGSEVHIKCVDDGAVELYYNDSLKLHTVNAGVEIEGNLQVDGSGTSVTIQPTDGLINFGMDGRSSFVTGTNSCYIYSGSGASGSMPAGDLIIQSRSDQNRTIRFVTGSSPAQRMSIDSGGLKFGTDTADANALDDYEEGSFTPIIKFGGNTNNQTYAYQMGRYTKIGNRVVFHLYVKFSNKGTASGAAHIYGLPFAAASISVGYAHCSAWMNQGNFGETVPTGYVPPSQSYYNIERQRCDNGLGVSACDNTNFNNNTDMMVNGSYITTS